MHGNDISKAYQLVYALASRGGMYSPEELFELTDDVERGTPDLSAAQMAFTEALHKAEDAMVSGDDDQVAAELIRLRVSAMNVVADMESLVDAISELFERKSVRR
jgi:hypothetical protein